MRRRLLALLAAPLLGGAFLIAGAGTAQAACPTAGHTSQTITNLGSAGVDSWVTVTTYWVRCDNGTPSGSDDYERLQSWRYDDGPKVGGSYEYPGDANPSTKWYCSGSVLNAVNGWNVWGDNMTVTLGGQSCVNWTVVVRATGEIDFWTDQPYTMTRNF